MRIVLIGAGHGHLEVARSASSIERIGASLTLIDPGVFWYSGLATGMLAGMYAPAVDQLDPRALIEASGGQFVEGRVVSINRRDRVVELSDGRKIQYDLLSLSVGSEVRSNLNSGAQVWPVKPIADLARLRQHVERWPSDKELRLVVVGGGPTGSEISACLRALCRRNQREGRVTLVTSDESLLDGAPSGAGRRLRRELQSRGIEVRFGERATGLESNLLSTDKGSKIPFDALILATGLSTNKLITQLGLPYDESRGLRVNRCLQSVEDDRIFAVGDCADIEGESLPRLGVFGVKASPILVRNLIAAAGNQPLRTYKPQSRYLAVLNMGDGYGLALWGRLWWFGKSSMKLKHRIDTRFLDEYRSCYNQGRSEVNASKRNR